jgi:hypothetical protein
VVVRLVAWVLLSYQTLFAQAGVVTVLDAETVGRRHSVP